MKETPINYAANTLAEKYDLHQRDLAALENMKRLEKKFSRHLHTERIDDRTVISRYVPPAKKKRR